MFSRVLLKNWNDSATCVRSTKCTCDTYVTFGVPSREHVASTLGITPSRQLRMSSSDRVFMGQRARDRIRAHGLTSLRTAPARGPGVWP